MNRYLRLFHTLRHLRLRQIIYQVFYRLSGRLQSSKVFKQKQTPPTPKGSNAWVNVWSPLWGRGSESSQTPPSFTFLNLTKDFGEVPNIDWNFAENGKLWTYNLNYFEFLRQASISNQDAQALIDDWITKSATHRDGWEPYPLSLRIVQWLRFYQERNLAVPDHVTDSLYQQYRNLQRKIEYHLMGNHLLENAIALTMAAEYFGDGKYLKQASSLLLGQLKEQYLATGAHFERSTMYHIILLGRQLDLYAHAVQVVVKDSAAQPKPCYFEVLKKSIIRQLNWLRYVVDENGNYPHFNDSTNGIAPPVSDVLAYAKALDSNFGRPNTSPILLPETIHWTWPRKKPVMDVWIDASSVGPSYIPGHAHADDLTFCVSLGGRPIIVDTAISTYEKNARRAWERSTAAHNTVTVNGQNSSDVWGGFRVGKRARTSIERMEGGTKIVARHDGYPGGHRRTFELVDGGLNVTDTSTGKAVARFHFDATCPVKLTKNSLKGDGFTLTWPASAQATLSDYQQAVGFNLLKEAQVLELEFDGELQLRLRTSGPLT